MFKTSGDVDSYVTRILNKRRGEKEGSSRGFQFAKLYHDVGDNISAKRHLQAFLSVQQAVPQAHKLLGQIHESLHEKTQALNAYKRSLELSNDQNDLILRICELYSDADVPVNKKTIQFWIDKAEKRLPDNETIVKLKERLKDEDSSTEWEEFLGLISKELKTNLGNVQLHVKVVSLLRRHLGMDSAYKHAITTATKLAFVSCPDWYECLLQLFQAYEELTDCKKDGTFQTLKLFALSSLAFLKLGYEELNITAAVSVIYQLDQVLFECSGIRKQTADWSEFLTEMKGQLLYLAGLLLLKKALMSQMEWQDAKSFSAICFLLGETMKPMYLTSRLFQELPKDSRKFYERVQMIGFDRLSQGGHMIHEVSRNEPDWAAKLRQRLWTPHGREALYNLLFTTNKLNGKKSTSFLLQDDILANTSFLMPTSEQLKMYDSVAYKLHASSLNHLVWLALRYFKEDVQPDYEQLFNCQLFPDLKFNSSDMSSGDPCSLSQLDVQSFFYACVIWTSLDQRKCSTCPISDKPDRLPLCLTSSLVLPLQSEWWSAVSQIKSNVGSYKESQVWGVVMRGLETIRLVNPHTMPLPTVVMLARTMDNRIFEMESLGADIFTAKLTALQARSAFYWQAAQDIQEKRDSENATLYRDKHVKQQDVLFPDNWLSSLAQTKELREQIRFALGLIDMRKMRHEDALKGLEGIGMSKPSVYSRQVPEHNPCTLKSGLFSNPRQMGSTRDVMPGNVKAMSAQPKSSVTWAAAATLSQPAAKHQESSKSPAAPAANPVATTSQKTVFKGFTFTSTSRITDPKKSEAAQTTSTATFIPKPFSGFSLSAPMSKSASTGPGAFTVSPSARKQNLSTCSDDHTDEYEPNVDFKPVVPLPELIEVKTGEEDEDRMFCERAKMFRFDPETKQWKERGLGEMKILKHHQTKVVRILMRREQVLKLCANHRLTKEMKLMPMAALDKAWVWEAMDFSEEEMKYERLACKFKTAGIASKFKDAFEACQKDMSSDSTGQVKKVEENTKPKDQHATPKDQQATSSKPDLSTMFKSKPGSWTCDGCFIKNNAEILECPCCKTLKPGVKKEDVKPASTLSVQPTFGSSAKPAGTAFIFGGTSSSTGAFKFGAPAAGSLPGSEQDKVPIFGGQPGAASSSGTGSTFTPSTLAAATTAGSTSTGFKFASLSATTSSSIFGATTTTTASSSSGGFGSGGFQFGTTPAQNAKSTSIFPAASTPSEAPKLSPFNLPQPCKPASGFTFGTGSANSTTASESGSGQSLLAKVLSEESPSTKGFTFSLAKSLFKTKDPATSKPMLGMASTLGAANKSDFTFGNNPPLDAATTSSTTKSSGFTFSMSMKPTQTTIPLKSPEGFKSPTSPGNSGYYVNKEEVDSHIHFEPIIKLPDKVEVVTGEEDEEVLFVHRAKFFRLVNKEWKERGLGEMKILYNNQTKKARLLMRREQILKMCCNHFISPEIKFTHMPNSKGCVLVWFAIDFSEESEGTSEQLSIKFKTPEVVAEFLEGVTEARRRCAGGVETNGATGKSPIKAAADNGDDDDDDVIIVKEEKASAEEIQKAREFLLPDNFYLYLKVAMVVKIECQRTMHQGVLEAREVISPL